jgi:hypothetical protein
MNRIRFKEESMEFLLIYYKNYVFNHKTLKMN